ncbi:IucA/IucC family protein [Deinococcus deserti]|uniref:Putative siderophore biosynthesis protein n=1 Tax=Deinococcus deserti (strain DSM 17065 / CIP 109153 / LMG 22923 / VCD115) TaxID=546414 RepID=C1CZH2_DEIDV|nr:IucA/IucC family protein [Deinococcus deserti]ACO47220.2 putative siderophore biosynthesis protein [Deinococcus deserti VCD115]
MRAAPHTHEAYMTRRVVDALLRENVRGCLNASRVTDGRDLPFAQDISPELQDGKWLTVPHWTGGTLYFAVRRAQYLQDWVLRALPVIWCQAGQPRELHGALDILAAFRAGLPAQEALDFAAFDEEYRTAVTQRWLVEDEHASLLSTPPQIPTDWGERTLHLDRLGAFLDHPVYPTARAKTGFGAADLRAYAPEFAPVFELRWLTVPRARVQETGETRPLGWPDFAQVGLPAELAHSHVLLPVHPFMWGGRLELLLKESALDAEVVAAPRAHLKVSPTLSVRTVALVDEPHWHLKLPLDISTLGLRNRRFVHPGTLGDGARMQGVLGEILRQEGLEHTVLLTDETASGHAGERFLAYLLRRYPQATQEGTLVTVASLLAPAPGGGTVLDGLLREHYQGDFGAFWAEYADLTLRLHLTLWLRYGVALESNQQNTALVLTSGGLRLLLKDNDSPRVLAERLAGILPEAAAALAGLDDQRIFVDGPEPLAQMFTTITLHLNLAALVHGLGRPDLYRDLRRRIEHLIDELKLERAEVEEHVLDAPRLPVKYMLSAGSLLSKARSGAADVNKYYGLSGPNYLR